MTKTYRKYRKGNFNKRVKNVVRKMSETKVLFQPFQIQTSTSSRGGKTDIVQIGQGSGGNQRIGSTLQLRHLTLRGILDPSGIALFGKQVRVMLFYSPTQQASDITLQDYLTGSYDPKQLFPLMDRYIRMELDYNGSGDFGVLRSKPINISRKIRYYQKYIGPNPTDLQRGNLIFVINHVSDQNASVKFDGRMEVWFDDV